MLDNATVDRPRGRPTVYTDEIASEICERLAAGESLNAVCKSPAMPCESTVRHWVTEDYQGFFAKYTRARLEQAECFVDEIVDLADSVQGCTDSAIVNAARLAIDARKWVASKLLPRKYGDRLDVQNEGSLTVKVVTGLADDVPAKAAPVIEYGGNVRRLPRAEK